MKSIHSLKMIAAASLAILISGCSEQKMPEVNDFNCQIGNIKKIEDKAMQENFSSKCLRRGNPRAGEFKPSPEKTW